jgi:hypothetical protein
MPPELDALARSSAARSTFVTPEAVHLHDPWQASAYSALCFEKRRWLLLVQQRNGLPHLRSFGTTSFSRFPLQVQVVANRAEALKLRTQRCWRKGTTFVADLRHAGQTMGLAHFAKRILRLHGLQRQSGEYQLPTIVRVAFPATTRKHLEHSWPSSLLRIVASNATVESSEDVIASECCYETVITSARENTYFVRSQDADAVRRAAWPLAGLPAQRPGCAPINACYFQRSEGRPGGRWEGGARVIVNRQELLRVMVAKVAELVPGGAVRIVNINSTHSFAEQVDTFARCDLLVSVHGSQNANIMFMRPGAAFMELNPHKFFYASYEELATVAQLLSLPSRRNSIAASTRSATRFLRDYANFSDDDCQLHSRCRSLSRNFPTLVNVSDFTVQLSRGLRHITASFPRPAHCPALPPSSTVLPPGLSSTVAKPAGGEGGARLNRARRRALGNDAFYSSRGGRSLRGAGGRGGKGGGGVRPLRVGAGDVRPADGGGQRVAVCITGQLSRLEIHSKVENVLKPTAATRPAALDVFLALEVGKTLYSNLDFGAILAQQHSECGGASVTEQAAREKLAPWLVGARFSNHTTRSIDLSQWRRYRKDRPQTERMTRLQHHLSQFAHMRTCAQLIQAHEVRNGWHYDVVLKMRDNTLAVSPFVVGSVHATGRARTKRCVEWGGYNDKAMTIPRRYMDGALRAPSEDFFLSRDIGRGIPNSERLLRAVLDRNGVKVDRVDPEALPLVDGRCSPFGWCLVEEGKDCHPRSWTWPSRPCEQLNATATQRDLYAQRFKPRAAIEGYMKRTVGVGMNGA